MKRTALIFAAAVTIGAGMGWGNRAGAHHSEAPFYDQTKTVDIRGVVTRWVFRNPHPFLYVDVADDTGAKHEWVLEFVGPVRLIKVGWSAKTFVPGEIISATGHPSREPGTYGLSPLKVARADGTVIPGSGRGGAFAPEGGAGRGN